MGDQPANLPNADRGNEKEMKRQPRQTNIFPAHVQRWESIKSVQNGLFVGRRRARDSLSHI